MALYITGDTHGDFHRFSTKEFPEQKEMTRDDFVIICGDFGGIWNGGTNETYWLTWLSEKPFTVLFVDGNHECLHKETEILTENGWMNIVDAYNSSDVFMIASIDLNSRRLVYERPIQKNKIYSEKLIYFDSPNYKQCVTPSHDIIVNGTKIKAKDALGLKLKEQDFRYEINEVYENNFILIDNNIIKLLVAIIMDGTIVDYNKKNPNSQKVRIQFHFKRQSKIDYIKELLQVNCIEYTLRKVFDGSTFINIYGEYARKLYEMLSKKKQIPVEWRYLDISQFESLLECLKYTDGSLVDNRIVWRSTSKINVDIITELCIKHNYDISVIEIEHGSGYSPDKCLLQYSVSIGKDKRLDHSVKTSYIDYKDYAYCFTMPHGTLVTRYKMTPCITGNCFDRLYSDEFPVVDFHGGKAHQICDNIYHLMRGQIFTLCNKTFFTFGGASSHDIEDGILDEADYPSYLELRKDYNRRRRLGESIRINHYSWWKEELPSEEEMEEGRRNLAAHNNKVDFVISHSPPQQVCSILGYHNPDRLTVYFDDLLRNGLQFQKWYSGHLHLEETVMSKFCIHYEDIERIL